MMAIEDFQNMTLDSNIAQLVATQLDVKDYNVHVVTLLLEESLDINKIHP